MAAEDYPNTGAMFAREKKSEKAADMGGDFTLEGDVLDYVIRCAERGEPVKLEIAGWKRRTRQGGQMLSVKIQTPYEQRGGGPRQNNYNRGAQPQRGGYSGRGEPARQERPYGHRDDRGAPPRQGSPDRPGYREMRRDMHEDEIPFGNDRGGGFKEKWD